MTLFNTLYNVIFNDSIVFDKIKRFLKLWQTEIDSIYNAICLLFP